MMDDSGLGLPLEYQVMPEYFDAHNICDDSDAKNIVLLRQLKKHEVKSVLDLTCGTGSQVFFLEQKGYKATGSDFSPALLDIARRKAHEAGIDVEFIDGDMRSVRIGEFDAAITMFNAIGHLSKLDFEVAIKNIRDNLKTGGIYVFDIYNLAAMSEQAVGDLAMDVTKSVDDTKIHNIQYSTLDRSAGRLTSYDKYAIQSGEEEPRHLKHQFTLQIYTPSELRKLLEENGFETVDQIGMDGSKMVELETTSVLTIARKC